MSCCDIDVRISPFTRNRSIKLSMRPRVSAQVTASQIVLYASSRSSCLRKTLCQRHAELRSVQFVAVLMQSRKGGLQQLNSPRQVAARDCEAALPANRSPSVGKEVVFGRNGRQAMDQLFRSLPVPGLKGDDHTGHEYVAKSEGMIQILGLLDGFFGHCHRLIGVSQHPQVMRQDVILPCARIPKLATLSFDK